MARLGSKDWRWLRLKADLSTLPREIDLSPGTRLTLPAMALGALWMAPFWVVAAGNLAGVWPFYWFSLFFLAIGGYPFLGAFRAFLRRRKAIFRAEGVEVAEALLWRRSTWYQPYTAFRGLLRRQEEIPRRDDGTFHQIIELLHDEPGKSLLLFAETSDMPPRQLWEDYARQLKVPLLELEGDKLVERRFRDLGTPLKERARRDKLGRDFDSAARPPAGLVLEAPGSPLEGRAEGVRLRITAPRVPFLILAIFLLAGLCILAAGLGGLGHPLLLALLALPFIAVSGYLLHGDLSHRREILIEGGRIIYRDGFLRVAASLEELALEEVETVTLRLSRRNSTGRVVVVGARRGEIHIGSGLSEAALAWLRDYLTATIARA